MVTDFPTPNRREFLSGVGAVTIAAAARTQPRAGRWPSDFPALRQQVNGHSLTYLDSAATTLRPQSVIDALVDFYSTDNANPAPVHRLASRAAERLATARAAVARFINAADPLEIVFVRGTTEGVNLIASSWGAANVKAGDEIVVSIAEHYSNLLPWRRLAESTGAAIRVADVDDEGRLTPDRLSAVLSPRTRLVAISHVSNVLGYINDVKALTAAAKTSGALVMIDGAQGAPHTRIDVRDFNCDFYVFSGHKMLGPMGTGVVWARASVLEAMPPYHVGSNMAHDVTATGATLEHGAMKYQAGTPDVAGPVGVSAAVSFLETAGHPALQQHDEALSRHGLARLAEVPGLTIIGPRAAARRVPVFAFNVRGHRAAAVAAHLNQRGIAVRAGDMAALPLLRRFYVTEAVRASAYVYSTTADLDRLTSALMELPR